MLGTGQYVVICSRDVDCIINCDITWKTENLPLQKKNTISQENSNHILIPDLKVVECTLMYLSFIPTNDWIHRET